MSNSLYNPFLNFDFNNKNCFLCGQTLQADDLFFPIIPNWLLKQAGLTGEEQIKFLDESIRTYKSLTIPVNKSIFDDVINPLEEKIENAFSDGYKTVSELDETTLFNWVGKFLYGFIYIEMHAALRTQMTANGLNMSQSLMLKFANLNQMLQNLTEDIVFENFKPWSITVVELEDKETPFSFRDEINTLTFSLKFKDFGLVACLQDNGTNNKYHQEILDEIKGKALSAQQFEELCARFYYSAYLFNRLPEYNIMPVNGTIYIEAMPLKGTLNKPLFDAWQHKTYGQVLENFWKPWGHVLFEIIKKPEQPMSYFDKPCLPNAG